MVLKRGEDIRETEVFGTEEALAKISMELLEPRDDKLLSVTDVLLLTNSIVKSTFCAFRDICVAQPNGNRKDVWFISHRKMGQGVPAVEDFKAQGWKN